MVSKITKGAISLLAAASLTASCAYYSAKTGLLNLLENSGPCVEASIFGSELYCKEFTGGQSTIPQKLMEHPEVNDLFRELRINLDTVVKTNIIRNISIGYNLEITLENRRRHYLPFNTKQQAEHAAIYLEQLIK